MRRLITMTISALAAGVALLAGSGPAHADMGPVAAQSSGSGSVVTAASEDVAALSAVNPAAAATVVSVNEQDGEVGAAGTWQYHSWYWTESACAAKGAELQRTGQVVHWACRKSWPGWELMVWR